MSVTRNGMRKVVLVDGCRTPFLRAGSEFRDLTSYDLGRMAIKGLLDRTGVDAHQVDRVIMGSVISNLATSNVAREAALAAGVPNAVPAVTVTQACISGNMAVTTAVDLIGSGQADMVIAGGTELMSDIPIKFRRRFRLKLIESQRYRKPLDWLKFVKGLHFADLLPEIPSISEYSTGRSMGQDCDRMAARIGVSRADQDEYALRSHLAAATATEAGQLAVEIVPTMPPPAFQLVQSDNGIRGDSTLAKMASLRPAFEKKYGTLTAANSSFLTDGGSACLIMTEDLALALGYTPKALFHSYVYSAQDPLEELLLGPAYCIPRILDAAGLSLQDVAVYELHEAFAAQVLANLNLLNSDSFCRDKLGRSGRMGDLPLDRLNTRGGSLSIGHPFGATGVRLITTAANRLIQEGGEFALVASCAAGALGNAILLQRYPD